jgi:hypothetical protein
MAMRSAARAPVLLVLAGTSCQPVDTADVAQRLAEIVRTGPLNGLAADLDGPQVLDASRHTAGDVLAVIGARRSVRPVWIPGRSVPGSGLVIISPRHAARRADMAFIPLGPLSGGARCPPAALYQRRVPIRRR